jgi:excisionase family DNA binding protein
VSKGKQSAASAKAASTLASAEQILTITELAAYLRVHPTTIYRLLREGGIPGFRVGNSWRFSQSAVEKWERGRTAPVDAAAGKSDRRKPGTPARD